MHGSLCVPNMRLQFDTDGIWTLSPSRLRSSLRSSRTDGRTDGGRASGVPFQLGAVPIHGNGKPDVSDFAMRQTEGETLCCLHGRRPAIRKGGSDSSFRNWVRKSETGRPATE
jgi:hypothetical protein